MLSQLSSHLASCIDHDPIVTLRLQHDARYYLKKLYFDAVAYGTEKLGCCHTVSKEQGLALRALGSKRMLFGTDHQFFPPLSSTEKWKSTSLTRSSLLRHWRMAWYLRATFTAPRPTEFTATGDRKPLVPKHGNSLIMQLILNGMKIQVCRPSFLDARDAILDLDEIKCSNKCPVK
ncbi:hypothetical protein BKA93DRAFT_824206 [Sparassis latifolia]